MTAFSIDVRGDTKKVLKDLGIVSDDVAKRAQVFAINRAAQATETRVRRETAANVGVSQKLIRPKMRRLRATFRRPLAELRYLSGGVLAYKAGKKPQGSQFMATMKSGHKGIFYRKTPKRTHSLPIGETAIALIPSFMRYTERLLRTFTPGEYIRVFDRDLRRRIASIRILR